MPTSRETPTIAPSITLDAVLKAAQAPSSARADAYAVRVDAHLASLPDDAARLAYLGREKANWFERYEGFCTAIDGGTMAVKPGGPTAWDYLATINMLAARQARYEPSKAFWEGSQQ